MNYEKTSISIEKFSEIIDDLYKNNNQIKELDKIINNRNILGYDNSNNLVRINDLYKKANELKKILFNSNVELSNELSNIEKYALILNDIDSLNNQIKELDEIINNRNVLDYNNSNNITRINKLYKDKNELESKLKGYDVNMTRDRLNLVCDKLKKDKKLVDFSKQFSNVSDNEKLNNLLNDTKNKIDDVRKINSKIEKYDKDEKVALLSEKRHLIRRKEELGRLLKERKDYFLALDKTSNNYFKYKYIIYSLENDYRVCVDNLNALDKKLTNINNIDSKDIKNISDKSKSKVSSEKYFKNYTMSSSKLDNIEKYGVSYTSKKIEELKNLKKDVITLEKLKNENKMVNIDSKSNNEQGKSK